MPTVQPGRLPYPRVRVAVAPRPADALLPLWISAGWAALWAAFAVAALAGLVAR